MLMLDFQTAIDYFHKALSLKRNDTFTCTLLNTALEELCADTSSVLHIIGMLGRSMLNTFPIEISLICMYTRNYPLFRLYHSNKVAG